MVAEPEAQRAVVGLIECQHPRVGKVHRRQAERRVDRPSRVTSSGTRRSTPSLSGEALRAPEAAAARPSAGTLQTAPVPAKSDATGEVAVRCRTTGCRGCRTHDEGGAPGATGSKVSAKPATTFAVAMAAASCRSVEVVGSDPGERSAEPVGLREQDVETDRGGAGVAQR